MTPDTTGLRHDALVYGSLEEYLATAVAFLREGLARGEGAVVAHTRPGMAAMRESLGDEAAAVTFVDVGEAYTRPARTLAAYHEVYAEQLNRTPSLRAVADVQYGLDPAEWDLWTAYESALNASFAHLPAWVLCTYDGERIPDPVLDAVWRTHATVRTGDVATPSDRFEPPDQLLRRLTPPPAPLPSLRSIGAGRDAEDVRERLARAMSSAGVPEHRSLDMLLAATEIVTNAVRHGGGVRDVRAGRADGRFACEVVDAGVGFDDPVAGFVAPRPGSGSGLWVARQLTWRIDFFRAPEGFTAQIVL
jgi:anti-sigma regulatory factor (Ser/Thr protein kinase)